jgi:hypothetical protein
MRSRALIVILVIGICGMAALGIITKLALENDPGLRQVIQFKAAVLQAFEKRGVTEVSYRRLPGRRGAVLQLVADPEAIARADHLELDIAELYLRSFPQGGETLKIVFLPPSRLGCGGARPLRERELRLAEVRLQVNARAQRERLAAGIDSRPGLRLLSAELEQSALRVDIELSAGEAAGAPPDMDSLLRELGAEVARLYQPARGGAIFLRLLQAQAPGAVNGRERRVLAEGRFDGRGRELPAPQPAPAAAPDRESRGAER